MYVWGIKIKIRVYVKPWFGIKRFSSDSLKLLENDIESIEFFIAGTLLGMGQKGRLRKGNTWGAH